MIEVGDVVGKTFQNACHFIRHSTPETVSCLVTELSKSRAHIIDFIKD